MVAAMSQRVEVCGGVWCSHCSLDIIRSHGDFKDYDMNEVILIITNFVYMYLFSLLQIPIL